MKLDAQLHEPLPHAEVRDAYTALGFTEISNRLIGEWRTGLFARGA